MNVHLLSSDEVLAGYDTVSRLYSHIPPLSAWRAWECAAYRRYTLPEPVLDVGCGDGGFFRLLWPDVHDAVGVEMDPGVAEAARRSGVYRAVHEAPAHEASLPAGAFAAAFANCSLEHMDHLSEVLRSIARSLRPGAPFVLSVVTDHFVGWSVLGPLAAAMGEPVRARMLQADYERYHHLVNPLPPDLWVKHLEDAGFDVEEHVPILPELSSRLFLTLDQLWHLPHPTGEWGNVLYPHILGLRDFPEAFRQIVAGVLQMERDRSAGSGAVFRARNR